MSRNNLNPMGWHENPLILLDRRQYAYGGRYTLPIPLGYLLPFQLIRPTGASAINRLEIVPETGSPISVLSGAAQMIDYKPGPAGSTYEVVRFRGTLPLNYPFGEWPLGWYKAIIGDGVRTWQSDWFLWTTDDLVKLEWWHIANIEVDGGRIDYSDSFKFWVYIKTDIGMPQYPFEEEVDRRAGVDLPFRQTSSKQYQFPAIVSEYLMDCLRLVPTHAEIRIHHLDDVFRVTKLRHGQVSWIERGDIAKVLFTFLTNTVTSTYAQSAGLLPISGGERCLDVAYVASTFLNDVFGALNWPFEGSGGIVGPTYVLYSDTGEDGATLWLKPGNDITPTAVTPALGEVVFVQDSEKYYLASDYQGGSLVTPRILAVGEAPTYTITGIVLPGSTIRIEYRTESSGWQTAQTVPASAFDTGVDLGADAEDWVQLRLVLLTALCGEIFTTPVFSIDSNNPPGPVPTGVSYDTISMGLTVYE